MIPIIADVHERASGVPQLLSQNGAKVELRPLSAGDYDLGGDALVERKTVRGLHAAIVAGTFWPQIGKLRRAGRFVYVLVEGRDLDDGPISPAAVRGACIAVTDIGVTLLQSLDVCESALWLYRLAKRRHDAPPRNRPPYAQRPKAEAGPPAAEAALACVPGISTVCARALLSYFGTFAAVVAADDAEWEAVAGIGRRRASALAVSFHTTYSASHSR